MHKKYILVALNIALSNNQTPLFLKKMTIGRCALTLHNGITARLRLAACHVQIIEETNNKTVWPLRLQVTKCKTTIAHNINQAQTVKITTTTSTNSSILQQTSNGLSTSLTKKRTTSSRETHSRPKIEKVLKSVSLKMLIDSHLTILTTFRTLKQIIRYLKADYNSIFIS